MYAYRLMYAYTEIHQISLNGSSLLNKNSDVAQSALLHI